MSSTTERWFAFEQAMGGDAHYGWGTRDEALRYAEWRNAEEREDKHVYPRLVSDEDRRELELDDSDEAMNLEEELQAIAEQAERDA